MVDSQFWREQAKTLLVQYVREHSEFTANQAFKWCFENGLIQPPSPNVLGPTFKAVLIDENLVRPVGVASSDDAKAKGRKVTVYQSVICAYQEGNLVASTLAELSSRFMLREIGLHDALTMAYELGLYGRR